MTKECVRDLGDDPKEYDVGVNFLEDNEKSAGDTRLTDGLPSERRFAESERGLGERRYVGLDASYG